MSCLDEHQALAFAAGQLDDAALAAAIAHLDGCDACRVLVAAAATGTVERGGAEPVTATRGQHIGRFVVEGVAGAGAMGIVYRARDPRLGRTVALKVLRPDVLDAPARARFEREARALARINHPNVVAIYEVGEHDGAAYLAMEHLPGTLADWLAAGSRRTAEIVAVLVGAGEGLLAAHDAGLVHRDFKPANVLLDADGRVRVTDFGLAHVGGEAPAAPARVDDVALTHTGMLLGTPAYMAPEQHAGGVADPRSDQFAFCVTLFEALAGHRPHRADDYPALVHAVQQGRLQPPARPIPRPVHRVLRRGLAPAAGDRFPSMRALLDELRRHARPRRWRLVALLAAAALLGGAIVGTRASLSAAPDPAAPCGTVAARWRSMFGPGGTPILPGLRPEDAAEAFASVERFGADWVAGYLDTCAPTVPSALARVRRSCLDGAAQRARHVLGAPAGSAQQTRRMLLAVRASVDRCGQRQLRDLAPEPALARPEIAAVRALLARSAGARWRGDGQLAAELADRAIARARSLDYPPVLAEALLERGLARSHGLEEQRARAAAPRESETHYRRAHHHARQARHHAVARMAAEQLAWMHLVSERLAGAGYWLDRARELDGVAPPSASDAASREIIAALLDEDAGAIDAALDRLDQVERQVRRERLGEDVAAVALQAAVLVALRADRPAEALDRIGRLARDYPGARDTASRLAGDPRLIEAHADLGLLHAHQGRAGSARGHLERAVTGMDALDDASPRAATVRWQLARLLADTEPDRAARLAARARDELRGHDPNLARSIATWLAARKKSPP